MSKKSRGINAERELIHTFWRAGWAAARIAGSGSIKYPAPDVIAGNNIRRLVIEIKLVSGNKKYLTAKEVEELQEFANLFGAEPWIGIKFSRLDWYFLTIEDLEKKESTYYTDIILAKRRGLSFQQLIGLER